MKQIDKKLQYLGIYQIIGGLIGLLPFIQSFFKLSGTEAIIWFLTLIFLGCLYIYSIFCGYLLIAGKYKKGINLSIINQAFQIIGFSVFGYGFKYVSGILIGLKLDLTNDIIFSFDLDWSMWKFNLNADPDVTYVSFNLLAIILLNLIFKWKEQKEKTFEINLTE